MMIYARLITLIAGMTVFSQAYAYIGPGAGLSALGAILSLIGAVILMVVGFVWYPIKRIRRRMKKSVSPSEDERSTIDKNSNESELVTKESQGENAQGNSHVKHERSEHGDKA